MAKKKLFVAAGDILSLARNGELTVRVTPNAGDNSISMPKDDDAVRVLSVRVTATPENGKANAAEAAGQGARAARDIPGDCPRQQ